MEHKVIIGISIVVSVAVIFGVHSWLHKLLKFKMDESAILSFIADSSGNCKYYSINAIADGTDISVERVTVVCGKSKVLKSNPREKNSWHI